MLTMQEFLAIPNDADMPPALFVLKELWLKRCSGNWALNGRDLHDPFLELLGSYHELRAALAHLWIVLEQYELEQHLQTKILAALNRSDAMYVAGSGYKVRVPHITHAPSVVQAYEQVLQKLAFESRLMGKHQDEPEVTDAG